MEPNIILMHSSETQLLSADFVKTLITLSAVLSAVFLGKSFLKKAIQAMEPRAKKHLHYPKVLPAGVVRFTIENIKSHQEINHLLERLARINGVSSLIADDLRHIRVNLNEPLPEQELLQSVEAVGAYHITKVEVLQT